MNKTLRPFKYSNLFAVDRMRQRKTTTLSCMFNNLQCEDNQFPCFELNFAWERSLGVSSGNKQVNMIPGASFSHAFGSRFKYHRKFSYMINTTFTFSVSLIAMQSAFVTGKVKFLWCSLRIWQKMSSDKTEFRQRILNVNLTHQLQKSLWRSFSLVTLSWI